MTQHTIPRSSQSSLTFEGEQIAAQKSPAHRRAEKKATCTWFECEVFRTKGGKFVVHVGYRWQGKLTREINSDHARVFDELIEAMEYLDDFDPLECITGFPSGERYEKQQQELESDVSTDWNLLVDMVENEIAEKSKPEVVE